MKKILDKRREEFDNFLSDRLPVLVNFMQDLGYDKPELVLVNAELFLPTLSDYLKGQAVNNEDRNWIISVLGYYIGEILIQKYHGYWFLNEDEKSNTYGKYVVGGFAGLETKTAVDCFEAAKTVVDNIKTYELINVVKDIIKEIGGDLTYWNFK